MFRVKLTYRNDLTDIPDKREAIIAASDWMEATKVLMDQFGSSLLSIDMLYELEDYLEFMDDITFEEAFEQI